MQFAALLIILAGVYLIDSGYRNRSPIGTIQELIKDPSDLTGTLARLNGTWQPLPGTGTDPSSSGAGAGKVATQVAKGSSSITIGGVTYQNGRLPDSVLVSLSWGPGGKMIPSAAARFEQLNTAFRSRFNRNIPYNGTYRTYAGQLTAKATKGHLAATPGTSKHGLGQAMDTGITSFNSAEYRWLKENAGKFGITQPKELQQGGSKPEPWHWEAL